MSVTSGTESSRNRRGRTTRSNQSSRPSGRSSSSSSRARTRGRRPSSSSSRESSSRSEDRVELSSRSRARGRTRRSSESPNSTRVEHTNRTSSASSEDQRPSAEPTAEERRRQEERDHISNLDRNFSVFDNPGGGDTDGNVSREDIERVAEGDYDRERAEERLREAGVPSDEIQDQLRGLERTADYLLENDTVRERLDVANDDNGEGNPDGHIRRGDLDRVMIEVEAENREARVRQAERDAQQPPSEAHIREAQQAVDRWSEPGALGRELGERPLSEFSAAELDALALVNEQDPQSRRHIEQAVLASVDGAESLDDLPRGDAYSYLLDRHVTGQEVRGNEAQQATNPTAVAQRQLDSLVRDEIEASLDRRLDDRRGDGELDLALERVSGDLEDLAINNPALATRIQNQAESTFEDYADEFSEVARRDDNWLQQANHAVTGAVRNGVGFLADGFRFAVDVSARITSAPTRLAGRLANGALDLGGRVAGAGLDAVGADGAADRVRDVSDRAGDLVQQGADFAADQNENFTRGLGESVAGGVEGIAYAVTDPVGTVQGIGQVVQDPSLLLEGYRETAREHGVAGAAGQVTGDVLLTVFTGGGGAAARGASAAGRVANIASRGGRVANFAARGATRVQNFLDDAGRAGGVGRHIVGRGARAVGDIPVNGRTLSSRLDAPDFEAGGSGRAGRLADRARRRAAEYLNGDDLDGAVSRADALREADPELFNEISGVRERFETRVVRKDADGNRVTDSAELRRVLDENIELAQRLDEVSSGRRPAGVGDILLEGRETILNHLRENFDTLDHDTIRRVARGVLADSDPSSPVYLTRLGPRDRVFRAYDSNASHANGGYFGRRRDRALTTEEQIANNALPERNLADRGVDVQVGEESLALVSRVGGQLGNEGFAASARGGGWQLQFLDNTSIPERLRSITGDDVPTPSGVRRSNPGEYEPFSISTPVAVGVTQLEALQQEETMR